MKLAILSDIHGNMHALRAVLEDSAFSGVESLLLLGDYVGYYYEANEVLKTLDSYDKVMLLGNHEIFLREVQCDENRREEIYKKYGSGINIALAQLGAEKVSELLALPDKKTLTIDGLRILISHGSPIEDWGYLYPDSDQDKFKECLNAEVDFVFIGHSHYAFRYDFNGKVLMNVGSVGQNRKQGGVASWAVLDTATKQCELVQTHYAVFDLKKAVMKQDPNHEYLWKILERE